MRTLYYTFPKIKAFGCCHEVFGTQQLLAHMLDDMCGIKNVKRREIDVNVLGINHFTWIDRASYQGTDLFPIYEKFTEKYADTGYEKQHDYDWRTNVFASTDKVKMDLFRRYGLIAAAGDRHLVEFLPPWYVKNPETVNKWNFHLTPVDFRKKQQEERNQRSERLVSGEEKVKIEPTGEDSIRQIKALLGLGTYICNVNLPNVGQCAGLPFDCIVETNAVITRDSVAPVYAGKLTSDLNALTLRHCYNMESILHASMTGDKELAFRAFMNDPLVTINLDDGRKLFATMLDNTKKYHDLI